MTNMTSQFRSIMTHGERPMTDIDVIFCRKLLSLVHADVRKHFPNVRVRDDAWVYSYGRDNWEFHGPQGFYWHGRAGNAYDARHKGWCAFLKDRKVEGYVNGHQ